MKRTGITRSAVAATTLLAVAWTSVPAGAATTDDAPGVGWRLAPGQKTLGDDPRAVAEKPTTDALVRLYGLYDQIEKPGLSDAQVDTIAARITATQSTVERLSGERIEDVAPAPQAVRARTSGRADVAAAAVPSAHYLPLTHSTQSTAYYCGPASTAMALRAMGASERSRLDGSSMSQSRLASGTYLATTESGGTYIYRMPTTMRDWAGVSSKVYTGQSRSELKSLVRRSSGQYNRAQIYGTHESAGGSHYNNHYANMTIDHFVMGYGYSDGGDRVHYADPLGGRWSGVDNTKSMSTNAMAGFTATYGTVA